MTREQNTLKEKKVLTIEERVQAGMEWLIENAPPNWWRNMFQPSVDGATLYTRFDMKYSARDIHALAFESEPAFIDPSQGCVSSVIIEKAFNIGNKVHDLGLAGHTSEQKELGTLWTKKLLEHADQSRLPYEHREPRRNYRPTTPFKHIIPGMNIGVTLRGPGSPEGPKEAIERLKKGRKKKKGLRI